MSQENSTQLKEKVQHPFSENYQLGNLLTKEQSLADLNRIVQSALKNHITDKNRSTVVARIDFLPCIKAGAEVLEGIFSSLIQMIVMHPPAEGRLFLHIKGGQNEVVDEALNLAFTSALKNQQIYFHTNIVADNHWQELYHDQLLEIKVKMKQLGGNLEISTHNLSGCLFTLTFPGKLN